MHRGCARGHHHPHSLLTLLHRNARNAAPLDLVLVLLPGERMVGCIAHELMWKSLLPVPGWPCSSHLPLLNADEFALREEGLGNRFRKLCIANSGGRRASRIRNQWGRPVHRKLWGLPCVVHPKLSPIGTTGSARRPRID
jgi:hypothetical protein